MGPVLSIGRDVEARVGMRNVAKCDHSELGHDSERKDALGGLSDPKIFDPDIFLRSKSAGKYRAGPGTHVEEIRARE